MLKSGDYFFTKQGKYLLLRCFDRYLDCDLYSSKVCHVNQFAKLAFFMYQSSILNLNVHKPIICDFPTFKNDFKIGDEIYFPCNGIYQYGIIKTISPLRLEEFTIEPEITNLVPYKWWKMYKKCKISLFETSKCLMKLHIYKDLRILICKYIWATKNDYIWRNKFPTGSLKKIKKL